MLVWLLTALTIIAAFFVCYSITPFIIERMKARGIVGRDMNKPKRPEVAEMGGIAVWLGLSAGIIVSVFCITYLHLAEVDFRVLFAAFSTIMMIGFLGVLDDLVGWKNGLKKWQHALVPVFAALPLMAVKIYNPPLLLPFIGLLPAEYYLPIIGLLPFGVIYSLIFVPIGVTGASNATNMLAGLNGLETGLGAITAFTLLIISLMLGKIESVIIIAAMFGALVAFLRYNWFPAKVFGGDALTLMIGAGIATTVIVGNMEKIGILLMALYFIELVLKARTKMGAESFGAVQIDGTLKAPAKIGSITHIIMRLGRFKEWQIVSLLLGMQAVISVVVFLLFFVKLII